MAYFLAVVTILVIVYFIDYLQRLKIKKVDGKMPGFFDAFPKHHYVQIVYDDKTWDSALVRILELMNKSDKQKLSDLEEAEIDCLAYLAGRYEEKKFPEFYEENNEITE